MYGWRAKIGLITPMSENIEHAFHIHAPEGVSFASTKFNPSCAETEGREVLTDRVAEAAGMYRDYEVDLVVFGCSSGHCPVDYEWEQECVRRIESASGRPGLSANTAVLEALKALGAKKVAVLTPYSDAANEAEKKFLEDNGLEVTNMVSMDVSYICGRGFELESCDEYMLYRNARRVDLKGADVFFLSSMELSTMELIDDLETVLGVPVVTGQQAVLWSALRHCRVGAKPEKLGKLFRI